jgi:hypothetical protein
MVRNHTLSLVARSEVGTIRASDQALSINDGDDAPSVRDPAPAFKFSQSDGYAWSGGPEHDPEELVSKRYFVVVEAIISQK